jgi:hypothetical protein
MRLVNQDAQEMYTYILRKTNDSSTNQTLSGQSLIVFEHKLKLSKTQFCFSTNLNWTKFNFIQTQAIT